MTELEKYLASYLSDLECAGEEIIESKEELRTVHPDLTELKRRFPLPAAPLPVPGEIGPGVVLELEQKDTVIPLTVAVLRLRGGLADVAVMSYAWKLATERDLIVPFHHLLGERWILEGDLVYSVPVSELESFEVVGEIRQEDCTVLLDFLDGRVDVLPSDRKGAGSFLDVKKRFKEAEQNRSVVLAGMLLSAVPAVDGAGDESEDDVELNVPIDLRHYLDDVEAQLPAAGMEEDTFLNEYVAGVYDGETRLLRINVHEEFDGKRGRLAMRAPGGSLVLFEGVFNKRRAYALQGIRRADLFSFKCCLEIILF